MTLGDSIHIMESLKLIIVSHHSTFNQQSIETILNELDVNPFIYEGAKILIDMRKADIKVDSDEIKEISTLIFKKLGNRNIEKFAIVIDAPQINKVVEFVKVYQQSSKYQVFAKLEGAMHWLKIPQERYEQISLKLNYLLEH